MNLRVHLTSASDRWSTPTDLFQDLNREFNFNLDPCPLDGDKDGSARLINPWTGKRVFCNPPYGPKITRFLECAKDAELAVFLLPSRTDTRWFHDLVLGKASEIRFLRGRLKFGDSKNSAPFPSMIVVYRNAKD